MKNWNCEWEVFGCVNFQCAKQCLFCLNLTSLGVLKIKINGSNRPNNRMNNQRHKTNNKLYLFIFLPLRLLNYRRWRAAAAQCSALWHCCGWLHSHVYGGFWLTKCHSSKLRREKQHQIQFSQLNDMLCLQNASHIMLTPKWIDIAELCAPWFFRFCCW